MARYILTTFALISWLASVGIADVKLPAVLGDNMVLQQGKKTAIWGTADPGEKVSVTLGDAKADTVSDDKGNWQVAFEPLTASDKPIEMTVVGKNTLKVSNILVGEVWLCAGQSNMGRTMLQTLNSSQEMAAADFPLLRLMTTPNLETEVTLYNKSGLPACPFRAGEKVVERMVEPQDWR
jgi:sialate O-acetylesterase